MNDPVSRAVVRHDKRYRCARALITFTLPDDDGNEVCVTCGRIIREAGP